MSSNFIFDGGFFFVDRTSSAVIFLFKFTWTVAENIDKETPVWVISRGFIGFSASGTWEGSVRPLVPLASDEYKEEKNPAVWDCFKAGWVFLWVPEVYIHFITSAWMYIAVITNNCQLIRGKWADYIRVDSTPVTVIIFSGERLLYPLGMGISCGKPDALFNLTRRLSSK